VSIFSDVFANGFDANSVEPAKDFEVLPPGKYNVIVEESEVKATKSGNGHYLKVACAVVDGEFQNRKLWANFNIDNPSAQAQQIGLSQLAGLCKAVGIGVIQDEQELVGKTVVASVKVKTDKDSKEQSNDIKAWIAYGSNSDYSAAKPSEPPRAPNTKPQQQAPQGKLPWQK
jgi:hypothetical protein